jgi:cell wall-associated protease
LFRVDGVDNSAAKDLMIKMNRMSLTARIAAIFLFLFTRCCDSSAQLSLQATNWSGGVRLSFTQDSLLVSDPATKQVISSFIFKQKGDTLFVINPDNVGDCGAEAGMYRIQFRRRGQQVSFTIIRDSCVKRQSLFIPTIFAFIHKEEEAARDWSALDPATDSIAGTSLYKAYDLLKGRVSTPVIAAVIDNGVDVEHQDLKDVIWTNTKEIPGNGIDDDHNGYVDDVHGWNFRGAKDGTIVENEQAEATHIFSIWRHKYEKVDTAKLKGQEKKNWEIYTRARTVYLDKIKESSDSSDLKFAYNLNYNSSALIGDDPSDPNQRFYGSPVIRLSPNLSHGTHVAGIIGARNNSGTGINGIAGNVLIMPLVATTAGGDERDKDVANAIRYAVDNGARVINMSFSKPFSAYKTVVDDAIRYAEGKNVLIVHSAGNDGDDNDTANHYPIAMYENGQKASNFISVGWSRPLFNYRLAHPNSNYGKKNVDLFAPGSDIFSTIPGNGYDFKSGSSMSAPVVSGIAALLFSYFPTLSAAQVKDILLQSSFKPDIMVNRPGSTVKVPFSSLSVSGAIVNAYNAVAMAIKTTEKNSYFTP